MFICFVKIQYFTLPIIINPNLCLLENISLCFQMQKTKHKQNSFPNYCTFWTKIYCFMNSVNSDYSQLRTSYLYYHNIWFSHFPLQNIYLPVSTGERVLSQLCLIRLIWCKSPRNGKAPRQQETFLSLIDNETFPRAYFPDIVNGPTPPCNAQRII